MLNLLTPFEQATAVLLAFYGSRDEPNDKDALQAIKLAVKWNKQRMALELRPFK